MTRILLIRHGSTDALGRELSGRARDIPLNARGRDEALALADRLIEWQPVALYASPLVRTRETAALLGERLRLLPRSCPDLIEFDFGRFGGKTFDELESDEAWRRFNVFRSGTRPPQGETMVEVQARMAGAIERMCADYPEATVAVVSHADPIKALLALWLGLSLDGLPRFEIAPAGFSAVDLHGYGAVVRCINVCVGTLAG